MKEGLVEARIIQGYYIDKFIRNQLLNSNLLSSEVNHNTTIKLNPQFALQHLPRSRGMLPQGHGPLNCWFFVLARLGTEMSIEYPGNSYISNGIEQNVYMNKKSLLPKLLVSQCYSHPIYILTSNMSFLTFAELPLGSDPATTTAVHATLTSTERSRCHAPTQSNPSLPHS